MVVCGVTDLIQNYAELDFRYREALEDMIGGSPEEMKEEYKKRSAYYWPEAINIPVLIIRNAYFPTANSQSFLQS